MKMPFLSSPLLSLFTIFSLSLSLTSRLTAQDPTPAEPFDGLNKKVISAFESGKAADLAALFGADGEWIDEDGTVYQGQQEIETILTAFFQQFPGAKIRLQVDSVRNIGPVAIEEGLREITVPASADRPASQIALRYIAVLSKLEGGWKIASLRDFETPAIQSPHDFLEPLGWMVGKWVNEGTDNTVDITYSWSEDGNFLLGEYVISHDNSVILKCNQRIGWDPHASAPRSWMFDSDGGYSDGRWTEVESGWMIKSQAVLPDASTGSATIRIQQENLNRFTMTGTDRVSANQRIDDFHVVVVRKIEKSSPSKE